MVTWQTNWDRDNANLTYNVMRNGDLVTPAYTVTTESRKWDRPYLSFLDPRPLSACCQVSRCATASSDRPARQ